MAEVTVFVDNAVRGGLPGICTKDGTPTTDTLTVRTTVGDGARLGVLWLLVFAGPIGWIVIFALSWSRSGQAEVLSVDLPMSRAAYDRLLAVRAATRNAVLATGIGILMAVWSVAAPVSIRGVVLAVGGAMVLGGFMAIIRADLRRRGAGVEVRLDASRRWVTLTQVHPAFAAACDAQVQERRTAEP